MTNILIADDHPIVRRGLKQILSEHPEVTSFGEAQNSEEVLSLLDGKDWDLVLLDLKMPGAEGLDLLRQVRQLRPKLPILVISMHPEDQYAMRVLRLGAAGYMAKESAPEELLKAIEQISNGQKYVSPQLGAQLAAQLDKGMSKPKHQALSDREYQVMCLIASGKTPTEIAEDLSLSVKTVSTYRARILEKMEMKTNAELMHYAMRERIVN